MSNNSASILRAGDETKLDWACKGPERKVSPPVAEIYLKVLRSGLRKFSTQLLEILAPAVDQGRGFPLRGAGIHLVQDAGVLCSVLEKIERKHLRVGRARLSLGATRSKW